MNQRFSRAKTLEDGLKELVVSINAPCKVYKKVQKSLYRNSTSPTTRDVYIYTVYFLDVLKAYNKYRNSHTSQNLTALMTEASKILTESKAVLSKGMLRDNQSISVDDFMPYLSRFITEQTLSSDVMSTLENAVIPTETNMRYWRGG